MPVSKIFSGWFNDHVRGMLVEDSDEEPPLGPSDSLEFQ